MTLAYDNLTDEEARELEHASEIDDLLNESTAQVTAALSATSRTESAIRELISNRVYDVELAEGPEGADALAELQIATRALRNAERIINKRIEVDNAVARQRKMLRDFLGDLMNLADEYSRDDVIAKMAFLATVDQYATDKYGVAVPEKRS